MKNLIKQFAEVMLGFFMTTFFPKEQDKAWHQMTGMYVAIVMLALNINSWITLGAVVALGVGYEVYQKITGKGTPEVMDAIRTILGQPKRNPTHFSREMNFGIIIDYKDVNCITNVS